MTRKAFRVICVLFLCTTVCHGVLCAQKAEKPNYAPRYANRVETDSTKGMDGILELTMEQAISYALEHNKDLLQTKNSVLKAVYSKREAIASYIPQANAAIDFNTYFNYNMSMSMGGGIPIEIAMPNTSSLSAQASQVLFNGNAMVGIMLGKISQLMAELNEQNAILSLRSSVSIGYHTALLCDAILSILQQNLKDMKDIASKTQAMVAAGAMEQTDADQIQVQVNLLENLLKNNERNAELAYNTLKVQLGMNIDDKLILTQNLDQLISAQNDIELLVSPYDIDNDPAFQLVAQNEEIAKKQKLMAITNFLPTLSGFYQYTYKILKPEFDMNPPHLLGLKASIPIFSGLANTNKHRQARIDLYNAELQTSLTEDLLKTQEKQLRFNLTTALEQYNTQKLNIDVATRVFKSFQLKYEQGVKSSMDLTNANTDYLQAHTDYLNSISQVLEARANLEKILGF